MHAADAPASTHAHQAHGLPCADCTFADLGGSGEGCEPCSSAFNAQNTTTINIVNSTFFALNPFPQATYVRAWEGARVLLSGCSFAPAAPGQRARFIAQDNATLFSDDESIRVMTDSGAFVPATAATLADADAAEAGLAFLQRTDPWFVALRQVWPPPPGCLSPPGAVRPPMGDV